MNFTTSICLTNEAPSPVEFLLAPLMISNCANCGALSSSRGAAAPLRGSLGPPPPPGVPRFFLLADGRRLPLAPVSA